MKKIKPVKISDIDVEPISDEELKAIAGQAEVLAFETDPGECCDNGRSRQFCLGITD